jgi:hypothetical protein
VPENANTPGREPGVLLSLDHYSEDTMTLTDSPAGNNTLLPFDDDRSRITRWLVDHRPGPQPTNAGITPPWAIAAVTLATWARDRLDDPSASGEG